MAPLARAYRALSRVVDGRDDLLAGTARSVAVDLLRLYLAVIVPLVHFAFAKPNGAGPACVAGYAGCSFFYNGPILALAFFPLTGFFVAQALLPQGLGTDVGATVRRFARDRALRILPLLLLFNVVGLALLLAVPRLHAATASAPAAPLSEGFVRMLRAREDAPDAHLLRTALLFGANWERSGCTTPQHRRTGLMWDTQWTMAADVQFQVLAVLAVLVLRRAWQRGALALGVIAFGAWWLASTTAAHSGWDGFIIGVSSLPVTLMTNTVGVVAFVVARRLAASPLFGRALVRLPLVLGGAVAMFVLQRRLHILEYPAVGPCLVALASVLVLVFGNLLFRRALHPVAARLSAVPALVSKWAYAEYLGHPLVLYATWDVYRGMSFGAAVTLYIVFSFAAGWAVHRFVERHLADAMLALGARARARASALAAALARAALWRGRVAKSSIGTGGELGGGEGDGGDIGALAAKAAAVGRGDRDLELPLTGKCGAAQLGDSRAVSERAPLRRDGTVCSGSARVLAEADTAQRATV